MKKMFQNRLVVIIGCYLLANAFFLVRAETQYPLAISISIPAYGTLGSPNDLEHPRSLSFRGDHFHVIISNTSNKEVRIWKEDCSFGYSALSFELRDAEGKHWQAKKRPRPWLLNIMQWCILQPGESKVLDVYFADDKTWEGFPKPSQNSPLKLNIKAVFEIQMDRDSIDHNIWAGKISSQPVQVDFYK